MALNGITGQTPRAVALSWYEPGLRPEGNRGNEISSTSTVKDVVTIRVESSTILRHYLDIAEFRLAL